MKTIITALAVLICVSITTQTSFSQTAEEMKKWTEYMTPGECHKKMADCKGTWKAKGQFWMDPKAEPTAFEGSATAEMILGGRYLMMKHSGMMFGMPFEGISIEGYDNATKMFNSAWVDNMGTGIMYMTGKLDDATKTISYTGQMCDPMTGKMCDVRQTAKMNDDGTMSMEMYGPDKVTGKEFKTMQITMTR